MSRDTYNELLALGNNVYDEIIKAAGKEWDHDHPDRSGDNPVYNSGLASKKEAAMTQAQRDYADIPEHFTRFATSTDRPPAIGELRTVAAVLNQDAAHSIGSAVSAPITSPKWLSLPLEDLDKRAGNRLDNWTGDAANAFKNNYLAHMGSVRTNQGWLAAFLAATLQAHQNIRDKAHDDIVSIGHNTITKLQSLTNVSSKDVTTDLSVVTAIASVLLAIPTDGASVGIEAVVSYGRLGTAAVNAGVAATTAASTISGSTVAEVVASMKDVMSEVINSIHGQEDELASLLRNVSDKLDASRGQFEMPQPGSATQENDKHTLTGVKNYRGWVV